MTLLGFAACSERSSTTSDKPSSPPAPTADPNAPDAPPSATGDAGGDASSEPVPYQAFDINHVLSTGQSNSVALEGIPPLTSEQPYGNLMFDVGVIPGTDCDGNGCKVYEKPTRFVPLVEGDHYFDYTAETMSSGLANEISNIARRKYDDARKDHDVLVSVQGRSGNTYACLRKGGCDFFHGQGPYVLAFEDAMMEVQDAMEIAKAQGKSYVVRAVTTIHGESDHYAVTHDANEFPMNATDGNGQINDYAAAMIEWQRDYERGVQQLTGQSQPVPLLMLQMNNWNDTEHSPIPIWQLSAHEQAPGKVVVVAPSYMFDYAQDCLHFNNHSERHIGEYFAKAYSRIVFEGRPWEPLRPIELSIDGKVITAKFAVPKPPLVFDVNIVSKSTDFGFEYADDSASPPAIADVAIAGDDTVKITLASTPTAKGKRLRYAYTATPFTCPGPQLGPRGNLRDSDDTPSQYGYTLFNWAVTFDEPIP